MWKKVTDQKIEPKNEFLEVPYITIWKRSSVFISLFIMKYHTVPHYFSTLPIGRRSEKTLPGLTHAVSPRPLRGGR
jgi:hypothetical protein